MSSGELPRVGRGSISGIHSQLTELRAENERLANENTKLQNALKVFEGTTATALKLENDRMTEELERLRDTAKTEAKTTPSRGSVAGRYSEASNDAAFLQQIRELEGKLKRFERDEKNVDDKVKGLDAKLTEAQKQINTLENEKAALTARVAIINDLTARCKQAADERAELAAQLREAEKKHSEELANAQKEHLAQMKRVQEDRSRDRSGLAETEQRVVTLEEKVAELQKEISIKSIESKSTIESLTAEVNRLSLQNASMHGELVSYVSRPRKNTAIDNDKEELRARNIVLQNRIQGHEAKVDSLVLQIEDAREQLTENERKWRRREAELLQVVSGLEDQVAEAVDEAAEAYLCMSNSNEALKSTTDKEEALRLENVRLVALLQKREQAVSRKMSVDIDQRKKEAEVRDELYQLRDQKAAALARATQAEHETTKTKQLYREALDEKEDLDVRLKQALAASDRAHDAADVAIAENVNLKLKMEKLEKTIAENDVQQRAMEDTLLKTNEAMEGAMHDIEKLREHNDKLAAEVAEMQRARDKHRSEAESALQELDGLRRQLTHLNEELERAAEQKRESMAIVPIPEATQHKIEEHHPFPELITSGDERVVIFNIPPGFTIEALISYFREYSVAVKQIVFLTPPTRALLTLENRAQRNTVLALSSEKNRLHLLLKPADGLVPSFTAAPKVDITAEHIRVSWETIAGAEHYAVAYISNGEWYKANAGRSTQFLYGTSYLHAGTYTFRVQAYLQEGISGPWSAEAEITI